MRNYLLVSFAVCIIVAGCQSINDNNITVENSNSKTSIHKATTPTPQESIDNKPSESLLTNQENKSVDSLDQKTERRNVQNPSDVKHKADMNQEKQVVTKLTPYQVLTKIREIEKFSGGTFQGNGKENIYSFLIPDPNKEDENIIYNRLYDISNGNVSIYGKKDFEVYYNLFDESTYTHLKVNPVIIQVDKNHQNEMNKIEQKLYSSDDSNNAKWSPNYQYVAYYLGNSDGGEAYLWKVGDNTPTKINKTERDRYFFKWSPDSRYLVLDTGTSRHRGGQIYNVSTRKISDSFGYIHKVYFSENSSWIAYSNSSEFRSKEKAGYEDDQTEEIWLMDLNNFEERFLIRTDDHTDYSPAKWTNDSELIYLKRDYRTGTKEELEITIP